MNRAPPSRNGRQQRRARGQGLVLRLLQALLACAALLSGPLRAAETCREQTTDLDADLLTVLQVTLDQNRLILTEAMAAYETTHGLFLPLGELMRIFRFPINVDAAHARAEGWFLNERRRFTLDLSERCRLSVEGASRNFDPSLISLHADELYVHTTLLEQWFPLTLQYDSSRLLVAVTAEEPLPVQQRLEREARWKRLGRREAADTGEYASTDVPYRYWDWPSLDATAETRFRQSSSGESTRDNYYRLVGAGDLLKMNTRFSASGSTSKGVDDWFVTMGRRDPNGDLLGPLGAREYRFGDLGVPQDPLIAANALGRGATISNFPLDHPTEFDRFTLEGELPIGWDVGLYRNGQLIDFHFGNDEERYAFTDVPLDFGVNRFRLVFHGPQGQTREEVVQRVIGSGMSRPGDQHYRLTAIHERDDRRLADQRPASGRFLASYELGVNRLLSLGGTVRSLGLDSERRDYTTGHVNVAIPRLFSRLEYATAHEGGRAVSALLNTRLAGIDISGETAHFFDFESERTRINQAPGELLSRSEVRLNTRLPWWESMSASAGATFHYEQGTLGERAAAQTRISVGGARGTFTHLFEMDRTVTDPGESRRTRQRLLVSRRYGPLSLQGEVTQELVPEKAVSHVSVSADWRVSSGATMRFGLQHAPQREANTYRTGVAWRLGRAALGASLQATDDHQYMAGLSISTSLVRDPGRARWAVYSRPQAPNGSVALEVFLDENGNGLRDPGEPPVPGARIAMTGTDSQVTTDTRGQAFVHGLPAHRDVRISLDQSSLENPFWISDSEGHQTMLRPGRAAEIDIPVLPTGGIEGVIYRKDGSQLQPVSNQPVLIFDLEGELLQQTRSGYDGYFYVDGLPPGHYRIRPEADEDGRWTRRDDVYVEMQSEIMIAGSVDILVSSPAVEARSESTPPSVSDRPPSVSDRFRTESWILAQPPATYTIQLLGAASEAAVQRYVERHGLRDRAAYFRSTRNGAAWYAVVYGRFSSYGEAKAAQQSLPPALREASPWPRRFEELHEIIEQDGSRG